MKCPACLTDNPVTGKFCREYRAIGLQCGADNLSEDKCCGECVHSLRQFPVPTIRLLSRQLPHPQVPRRKDSEEQKMYAPKPATAVGLVAKPESLRPARAVGFCALSFLIFRIIKETLFGLPLLLITDFFKTGYRFSYFPFCQNNH